MLCFLEKVTLTPSEVTPEDVVPLRAIGIRDQAIEDAIIIGALFNVIARMADSLNVDIPSSEIFSLTGERLLLSGYI